MLSVSQNMELSTLYFGVEIMESGIPDNGGLKYDEI